MDEITLDADSFQSTPSVGRATYARGYHLRCPYHFNPRPPWGGRLLISLLEMTVSAPFQSTPSVGRATLSDAMDEATVQISIHALRGEGDKLAINK